MREREREGQSHIGSIDLIFLLLHLGSREAGLSQGSPSDDHCWVEEGSGLC